MSTQVQYRRGSAAQNNSFVGALAEITVDTTNGTLRVHDGIAAGGSNIATVAFVDNAISSLSANSITDGTSSVTIIATNGNIRANVGGSTIQLLSSAGADVTGYVSATGNVSGGNVTTAGLITATGNISGGNLNTDAQVVATGNITGNFFLGNGSQLTGIDATSIQSGTSNVRVQSSGGNVSVAVGGNAIVRFTTAGIVNDMGNGVGNIGNSAGQFDTIFAKATSAQYADVAERYLADRDYVPGTVLEIGGTAEVQATQTSHSTRLVGVVSTAPALIMNSGLQGDHGVTVALLGRAPCRVTGTIQRGDLLVSSDRPGVAMALIAGQYQPGSVIGKALTGSEAAGESVIEVLVGRL